MANPVNKEGLSGASPILDSLFRSDVSFQNHTDEMIHKVTQPTEDLILERNSKLRNNEGAIRDLGKPGGVDTWGRQVASIPMILWDKAIRMGFDLNSLDKQTRELEMNRFLQSDIGRPCLVVPKIITKR